MWREASGNFSPDLMLKTNFMACARKCVKRVLVKNGGHQNHQLQYWNDLKWSNFGWFGGTTNLKHQQVQNAMKTAPLWSWNTIHLMGWMKNASTKSKSYRPSRLSILHYIMWQAKKPSSIFDHLGVMLHHPSYKIQFRTAQCSLFLK